ncbi:DUF2829 domain-containing protein [Methylobacterium sp. HMF5984]|uniref:DUF2829 domain-containing protein n=1 Tax=Methylobacterium sp. HMF5984 TaxID=3367370 RepID=UPI003852D818
MDTFKPTHVSHKMVEAYPLVRLKLDQADERALIAVVEKDGAEASIKVPGDITARGAPQPGSMLVRYMPTEAEPDGYLAFSPRSAFDEGYRAIPPHEHHKSYEGGGRGLTFGQAIEQLKAGDRVARDGWNGKGMFLLLVPGSTGLTVDEGRPLARAGIPVGTTFNYLPHIDMWTAQGDFVPWLASQTDMLAEDWCVVSGKAA